MLAIRSKSSPEKCHRPVSGKEKCAIEKLKAQSEFRTKRTAAIVEIKLYWDKLKSVHRGGCTQYSQWNFKKQVASLEWIRTIFNSLLFLWFFFLLASSLRLSVAYSFDSIVFLSCQIHNSTQTRCPLQPVFGEAFQWQAFGE